MFKNKISLILSMFLILSMWSCVTEKEVKRIVPKYNEALQNKLETLLEDGDFERILCYCKNLNDERLIDFQVDAEEGLKKRFEEEYTNSDFSSAVESLKSLIVLGVEINVKTYEIYFKQVLKKIDDNEIMPALLLFKRTFVNKNIEIEMIEEQYKKLIDSAIVMHDKVVLNYLTQKYTFPEYKQKEIAEVENKVFDKTEMISGSVTVMVDRGIQIKGGLGYPDRVIGSGFYIDPRGYLLTNYHVISSEVDKSYEGYSRLYLINDDNQEKISATVIGWDKALDVALLKTELTPDYFYNFSEPGIYSPGEKIYAIGSPGGLGKTITSGILSISKNRRIVPIGDTLQVDVPINSGNSGGPVIDEDNNLIGIVFAGIEQFEGVNFVIPAKWVLNLLPELYEGGRNPQTWLGLTAVKIDDHLQITYISPQTSLFETEVQAGDILRKIDEVEVNDIVEAQEIVQRKLPGTVIKVTVERNEVLHDYFICAEARDDIPMKKAALLDTRKSLVAPFFGMVIEESVEENLIRQYIIKNIYPGSIAEEIGLSVNDPFSIVSWDIDLKNNIILAGIRIKKRKAGFLEATIQLGNYLDILNTI